MGWDAFWVIFSHKLNRSPWRVRNLTVWVTRLGRFFGANFSEKKFSFNFDNIWVGLNNILADLFTKSGHPSAASVFNIGKRQTY
jgi:hypothetical protein